MLNKEVLDNLLKLASQYRLLIGLGLAVMVLSIISTLLIVGDQPSQSVVRAKKSGPALMPELANNVVDVDRIEFWYLRDGDPASVTLVKENQQWLVREKFFYPANQQKVAVLLDNLQQLHLAMPKTSQSEYYDQLGVAALDQEDLKNPGLRLSLYNDNELLEDIIIGKTDPITKRNYVRHRDEAQSWLLDGNLALSRSIDDWISPYAVNMDPDDIRQILIRHDSNPVSIVRMTPDDPFVIRGVNIKAERRYQDLESASLGLTELEYEQLIPSDSVLVSRLDIQVDYETWSGLVVELQGVKRREENLVSLKAMNFLTPGDEQYESVQERVEQLNLIWSRWVYEIEAESFAKLARGHLDFFDPEKGEQRAATEQIMVPLEKNKPLPLAPLETITLDPAIPDRPPVIQQAFPTVNTPQKPSAQAAAPQTTKPPPAPPARASVPSGLGDVDPALLRALMNRMEQQPSQPESAQ